MTTLFASFLSKIGPRAVAKAKVSPNSRAATELLRRLFGNVAEEELTEEQLQVWKDAVAAAEATPEEPQQQVRPAPVASLEARQQLQAFVRDTNPRNRQTRMTATHNLSSPFDTSSSSPTTRMPSASPPVEDLRVPARMGDYSNMVHVAQ